MADYNESTVSGSSWQRTFRIVIDNPHGLPPTINYSEEKVVAVNGSPAIKQYVGDLTGPIDLSGTIALRDPDTLELTGETVPIALVHLALFSDYINRAVDRDNAENQSA